MTTYLETTTADDAPTIRDGLLAGLAAQGSTVGGLPTSSPDRGLVETEAAMLALEQQRRAALAKAATITGAVDVSDSLVDADATWYQVDNRAGATGRIPAQAAVWSIGLVVASTAAPLTLSPGDIVQVQETGSGHQVYNLSIAAPVILNAGSSYKATVNFRARTPGAAANLGGSGTTIQFGAIITGPAGLSVDSAVTPTLVTTGRDPETSAALAERCLASWGRLGAGWTKQALDYLIPTLAPSVVGWRIDTSNPYGPGTVGVTLTDSTGPATGPETTPSTECYEVSTGLNAANVRPLGSGALHAVAAVAHALTVNITLAGDGTNANLHSDALAALGKLSAALLQAIGPAAISASLVQAVAMGGAYSGSTPIIVGDGPPFPTLEVPFTTPGFRGAASIAAFTTSTGNMEGTGFETLASGEVLVVTWVVTVE